MLCSPSHRVGPVPPIVKAEAGPAKVAPANPGGQKFEHTNSKLLGKLGGSDGKATNSAAAGGTGEATVCDLFQRWPSDPMAV